MILTTFFNIGKFLPVPVKIKIKRILSGKTNFYISQKGFCPVCNKKTKFSSIRYNYREDLICHNCGASGRHRMLQLALNKFCPNFKTLTIHESSPNKNLKYIYKKSPNYSASQFYPDKPLGIKVNDFYNENLEQLTFKDNSFDVFITMDVLEHLYNPEKAFSEIARVLKPGGIHLFTVPIDNMFGKTEVWAKPDENGEPIFLKEPEWHGNPVSSKGSPCTMHYGYDILDMILKYSGMTTTIYRDLSEINGIMNVPYNNFNPIEVFISKKTL